MPSWIPEWPVAAVLEPVADEIEELANDDDRIV